MCAQKQANRERHSGFSNSHFGCRWRRAPAKAGTPNAFRRRFQRVGVPPSGARGQNEGSPPHLRGRQEMGRCCDRSRRTGRKLHPNKLRAGLTARSQNGSAYEMLLLPGMRTRNMNSDPNLVSRWLHAYLHAGGGHRAPVAMQTASVGGFTDGVVDNKLIHL